jgi:hypothetical protein
MCSVGKGDIRRIDLGCIFRKYQQVLPCADESGELVPIT